MDLGHWSFRCYPALGPGRQDTQIQGIKAVSGPLTIIPSDLLGEMVLPDFATSVSTKDAGS